MSPQKWCGLCAAYTEHDTNHHDSNGGPAVGDRVRLSNPSDEWVHMKDRLGRVESVRGNELTIAFPTAGGTVSLTVDADAVT